MKIKTFTSKQKIVAIIFLLVAVGVVIYFSKREPLIVYKEKVVTNLIKEKPEELTLPLKYFLDKDIAWGEGTSDNKNEWDSAMVDTGHKTSPSTTITLSKDDYSIEIKDLPQVRTNKEIFKDSDGDGKIDWDWLYKDQIKEYGDLATRFIYEGYTVVGLEKFDVDSDGNKESIIFLCGTGGNHCPHKIIIVKNNKIVFTLDSGLTGLDLVKDDTGNGFFVHWVPSEGDEWDAGLCCPPGYMSTRFVYEKGKFIPIYEQKVMYTKVTNKKI